MEDEIKEVRRYPYIDALRGWAILGVLAFHAMPNFSVFSPHWFGTLVSQGARGVQLFYILSAVTLLFSFHNRSKQELHPIRNFYFRRLFRIAPLFYLAIFYYLWQFNYFNGNPYQFSFANILTTFGFINGVSPYWINNIVPGGWSITVEMSFYLFFPLFIFLISTFERALIAALLSLFISQVVRLYLVSHPFIESFDLWQEFTFLFFPSQLPVFMIGILTYFIITTKKFSAQQMMLLKIALLLIIVCILLEVIFGWKMVAGHYLYGMFFGFFVMALSRFPISFFVNRFTCYLGKISFSLYLSHFAVMYWMSFLGISEFILPSPIFNYFTHFIILSLLSSGLSTLFYLTIEKKGQLLGRRIITILSS